jgi:chromosome segregation ATPase
MPNMDDHEPPNPVTVIPEPRVSPLNVTLCVTTAIALVACTLLALYAHNLSARMNQMNADTQAQMAKMAEQISQNADDANKAAETLAQSARESTVALQTVTESESRKVSASLQARIDAQKAAAEADRKQLNGQLDDLKQANNESASKIDSLNGDVNSVRTDLAATQSGTQSNGDELKRVNGDMGVMSDRIATNAKELAELREIGERNYVEFHLRRNGGMQKVGNVQLALARVDPKRNRYTMEVLADDKTVEKRDKTINEPVQLYVSGNHQPVEIVVNEVTKDEVAGYVSLPKMKPARQ